MWQNSHKVHHLNHFQACSLVILVYTFTHVCSVVHVQLFVTPWTVALQAPLSMGFSRQEYWSGLSFPSPGKSSQPRDQTLISYVACSGSVFFTTSAPWEAQWNHSALPLSRLPSFTHVTFKGMVLLVQLVAAGLFSWLWGCSVTSCVFLHPEDGRLGCVHFRATVSIVALPILCLPLGARMYTFLWGYLSKPLFN